MTTSYSMILKKLFGIIMHQMGAYLIGAMLMIRIKYLFQK